MKIICLCYLFSNSFLLKERNKRLRFFYNIAFQPAVVIDCQQNPTYNEVNNKNKIHNTYRSLIAATFLSHFMIFLYFLLNRRRGATSFIKSFTITTAIIKIITIVPSFQKCDAFSYPGLPQLYGHNTSMYTSSRGSSMCVRRNYRLVLDLQVCTNSKHILW